MRITPHGKVVRRESKIRQQGAEDDAPIVLRLPEEPVAIGDTWDEPFDVQVKLQDSGTKSIQTRRHHKLADVKNGIATIEVTYQVLSPIDAHIESQIVQRLMEGEVRFDIEKGHVVSQQMDVDKRIIGFAGPTSSMQYIMKMEEKLLTNDAKAGGQAEAHRNGNHNAGRQRNRPTIEDRPAQRQSRRRRRQPPSKSQKSPARSSYASSAARALPIASTAESRRSYR